MVKAAADPHLFVLVFALLGIFADFSFQSRNDLRSLLYGINLMRFTTENKHDNNTFWKTSAHMRSQTRPETSVDVLISKLHLSPSPAPLPASASYGPAAPVSPVAAFPEQQTRETTVPLLPG